MNDLSTMKTGLGTTGCMIGTVGTFISSTHIYVMLGCALLTLVSLIYTIVNAKAKGRLQQLQIEHEQMSICLECMKNNMNGECSVPAEKRPKACPKKGQL